MLIRDARPVQRIERGRVALDQRRRACHEIAGDVLGDAESRCELESPLRPSRRVASRRRYARILLCRVDRTKSCDVGDFTDRVAGARMSADAETSDQ